MTAIGDPIMANGPDGANPYVRVTPKDAPATPAAQTGPRAPHIEEWIPLADPQYPEHRIRAWINFPNRLLQEINSGDQERILAALSRIVLEHNGWCDEDGNPYPPASDAAAFWESVSTYEAAAIVQSLQVRAARPNLAAPKRRD